MANGMAAAASGGAGSCAERPGGGAVTAARLGARCAVLVLVLLALSGCASLPGRDYPRPEAEANRLPPDHALIAPFVDALQTHGTQSGFRIVPAGVDGLLLRLELIEHAQRSLDLQYYIFHADESGLLIGNALVRAAQRGVRIRILVDDGETAAGDEKMLRLA